VSRTDGRGLTDLRPIRYQTGYLEWAEGSVLFEMGKTRVLCAASFEPQVPRFLQGSGKGWVTAEYGMLPRATSERTPREAARGRPSGRTYEIQRLIGRSLRAITRLDRLGEVALWIDCDVLQADGGTRTAAITGGYIALALAVRSLEERGAIKTGDVFSDSVAAISAGIVDGTPMLDLCYEEDSRAEVDFNVVMTGAGQLVEIQGTAEGEPFTRPQLDEMIALAAGGIEQLTAIQREAAGG
jgi:ribonuclease PH